MVPSATLDERSHRASREAARVRGWRCPPRRLDLAPGRSASQVCHARQSSERLGKDEGAKEQGMIADLLALLPPMIVGGAFLIGVILFLRRQMSAGERVSGGDGVDGI